MNYKFGVLLVLILMPGILDAGGRKNFIKKTPPPNSNPWRNPSASSSPGSSPSSSSSSSSSLSSKNSVESSKQNLVVKSPGAWKNVNLPPAEPREGLGLNAPPNHQGITRLKKLGEGLTVRIPEPQRSLSREEFPALRSSPVNNFARLSLERSPGHLPTLKSPLQDTMGRANSLRTTNPTNQNFIRGGSVGSNIPRSGSGTSWSSGSSSFDSGFRSSPSPSGSASSLNSWRQTPTRSRKLSERSQGSPEISQVTVTDETCKDDNSPAGQCFNYLTFSVFWPPALGYEYKRNNKPVNNNINQLKWSIHGLWPSSHTGKVPENCKKRTTVSFNQHRFNQEKGLRSNLENKWINICPYKLNGCSMVSFWDREFAKHGACASRSPLIATDVGYFKLAVDIMDRLNVAGILMNGEFKPGDKRSFGEIGDLIGDAVGRRARVEIYEDKVKNENYLKEVRVCYNLQLQPINCPGTAYLSESVRNKEIIYLDHVPNLP